MKFRVTRLGFIYPAGSVVWLVHVAPRGWHDVTRLATLRVNHFDDGHPIVSEHASMPMSVALAFYNKKNQKGEKKSTRQRASRRASSDSIRDDA